MRAPRVRFTIRGLMVAVAVVAVLAGAVAWVLKRDRAGVVRVAQFIALMLPMMVVGAARVALPFLLVIFTARDEQPHLSVEPDPPEP